jgi:hypothetical protein
MKSIKEKAEFMSEVHTSSKGAQIRGMLISLLPSLVIDALLPYLIYIILSPHTSELNALIASSIPPVISNIVSLIRARKIDAIGIIVFLGIVVSIVAIFLGGDPRLLLVRESLVTGVLGVACLVSLLLPKPLMFYISLHFAPKNANFYELWQYPTFRRFLNIVTIAWGVFFLAEFLLKVLLVYTLPIAVSVGVTPVVFYALLVVMILWTTRYGGTLQRQRQSQPSAQAADLQEAKAV